MILSLQHSRHLLSTFPEVLRELFLKELFSSRHERHKCICSFATVCNVVTRNAASELPKDVSLQQRHPTSIKRPSQYTQQSSLSSTPVDLETNGAGCLADLDVDTPGQSHKASPVPSILAAATSVWVFAPEGTQVLLINVPFSELVRGANQQRSVFVRVSYHKTRM